MEVMCCEWYQELPSFLSPNINSFPVSPFLIMLEISPVAIPFLLSTYRMQGSVYLRMRLKIQHLLQKSYGLQGVETNPGIEITRHNVATATRSKAPQRKKRCLPIGEQGKILWRIRDLGSTLENG